MKRILALVLALLTLTGCGVTQQTQSTQATEPVPTTEPAGTYTPGSSLELFTDGAVRAYSPELTDIRAIAAVGEDVLVFSGTEDTTLTRLTGENLYCEAQVTLDAVLDPEGAGILITRDRLVYYDSRSREVVWLDESFREFNRLAMPEDMLDIPVISADQQSIYYCTPDGIRVLDTQSGLSRLLKQVTYPDQRVDCLLMEDTVLKFAVSEEDGVYQAMFLDTATGALLAQFQEDMPISSGSGMYYTTYGDVKLFATSALEVRELVCPTENGDVCFLPEIGGAVCFGLRQEKRCLDYYDLESGEMTASVVLPQSMEPFAWGAREGWVYFLCRDRESATVLCRWDISRSRTGEDTCYTRGWYTRENPDVNGLARCQSQAESLSLRYDLDIRVWEFAMTNQPEEYSFSVAWETGTVYEGLETLRICLTQFPEDFFQQTVEDLNGSCLRVSLVAGITDSEKQPVAGIQFWDGSSAGVTLAIGEDMEQAFYHNIYHVMETRILSHSIALYRWDELNPNGFEYDYDYITNRGRDGSAWLGEDRWFIDTHSMSYPKEDRAMIFQYACTQGNGDYFASEPMQQKLLAICKGIREAYGLKKSEDTFLWEQYLESPLAYTK